jgi:16S rRNA (adenine1518-N6/adenine1519-N6)-dimethyltransferase
LSSLSAHHDNGGPASRLLTPTTIRGLLAEHGIRPSRALGQNFLADPNTARKIVALAGVAPGDAVAEIGPGLGSLTLALVEAGAQVTAVELDRYLADVLRSVVGDAARVIRDDALTVDWAEVCDTGREWSLVANLPYNVATPVVVRVLETAPQVTRGVVMVQREVGERLAATPGTKAYGAVTVKVAYYAKARIASTVSPNVFVPRPNVDSALVQFARHSTPPVDVESPDRMFTLVRAGFATRRKTLRNALAGALDDPESTLRSAGIDPSARAESLDLAAWARLADVAAHG